MEWRATRTSIEINLHLNNGKYALSMEQRDLFLTLITIIRKKEFIRVQQLRSHFSVLRISSIQEQDGQVSPSHWMMPP